MPLIGVGACRDLVVVSRRHGRVWRALFLLLLLGCAMPAMACDEGQRWGLNPDAIARATSMISEGNFPSNVSKGNCAVRLHRRLSILKAEAVCEACRTPYRNFLRVLTECLGRAIGSAHAGAERDFFRGYRERILAEAAQFDSPPSLAAPKAIASKLSVAIAEVLRDSDQADALMQSNARAVEVAPAFEKEQP